MSAAYRIERYKPERAGKHERNHIFARALEKGDFSEYFFKRENGVIKAYPDQRGYCRTHGYIQIGQRVEIVEYETCKCKIHRIAQCGTNCVAREKRG